MKRTVIFVSGIFLGVALSALGGWIFMRYTMQRVAEMEQSVTPNAVQELVKAGAELQTAKSEYERWVALGNVGFWTVDAGANERARAYAEELLAQAEKYNTDWNYGNAIHKGNLILGRLELKGGNRSKAKAYLLAAGKTRGSPQLNSFGPNMTLAKEMLDVGERDAVLEYFTLCGMFWTSDMGVLAKWREMVANGQIPNFGAHLLY